MRLEAVELRLVRLPLVRPFRSSSGTEETREAVLVRVETPTGEGWGECAASEEPRYSPEFNGAAWMVLRDLFAPRLLDAADVEAAGVGGLLAPWKGHRMAKAAIELAVLDAALRDEGVPLASYLGGTRASVVAGVAVGIPGSLGELLELVGEYVAAGYRRVKLKVEPGWDLEPVRAVREAFGPDLLLQVDANGAYVLDDARHLQQLDEHGLLLLEQPLDEEDLVGHAELAARLTTPICLDEPIRSADGARAALALGACSIVNVKAGRVGGYLEARRVHDVCAAAGVPVWCGGMLETGIGRAANLALASLPGFTLPADLSATDRYFREDVTRRFVLEDGEIAVPSGPGTGVEVVRAALDSLTVRQEVLGR
jgi:O-succinylbenzoate synthase